jgi:low affinity Fe/Cu permease
MAGIVTQNLPHSQEFTVDIGIEEIISKIVDGTATPEEEVKLDHLASRRTRMMRRGFSARHQGSRRIAA